MAVMKDGVCFKLLVLDQETLPAPTATALLRNTRLHPVRLGLQGYTEDCLSRFLDADIAAKNWVVRDVTKEPNFRTGRVAIGGMVVGTDSLISELKQFDRRISGVKAFTQATRSRHSGITSTVV